MKIPSLETLRSVYGETELSSARFTKLAEHFQKTYGHDKAVFFTSPGRTEIIGNHTDHNGGLVLAGSITLDTIGAAAKNGSNVIRILSEGYREFEIDISNLSSIRKGKGTTALVAGIVEYVLKSGKKIGGFDCCASSNVIAAAGVSSSASFEMLVMAVINDFFNEGALPYTEYAKAGQYAENKWWFKSSGLMDQMACSVGGPIMLSFKDPEPAYRKVSFSFSEGGYSYVIINTGKGHSDLSAVYSEIPEEMKLAAKALGGERLCDVTFDKLLHNLDKIKNDRAILRAFHFFEENRRVMEMEEAAAKKDFDRILSLIDESGASSYDLLQNIYTNENPAEQKISLALALSNLFLKKAGRGVCRVHGGGFAGVIAAVVPLEDEAAYIEYMSGYFGRQNVYPMNIRPVGAVRLD
ncbi:MAG: galactokinase [Lachnospiraceae bacterium]|nr:galactokinase [Lachnospiraceae bacterium]